MANPEKENIKGMLDLLICTTGYGRINRYWLYMVAKAAEANRGTTENMNFSSLLYFAFKFIQDSGPFGCTSSKTQTLRSALSELAGQAFPVGFAMNECKSLDFLITIAKALAHIKAQLPPDAAQSMESYLLNAGNPGSTPFLNDVSADTLGSALASASTEYGIVAGLSPAASQALCEQPKDKPMPGQPLNTSLFLGTQLLSGALHQLINKLPPQVPDLAKIALRIFVNMVLIVSVGDTWQTGLALALTSSVFRYLSGIVPQFKIPRGLAFMTAIMDLMNLSEGILASMARAVLGFAAEKLGEFIVDKAIEHTPHRLGLNHA